MNRAWWLIGIGCRIFIGLFILLVCAVLSLPYLLSLPIEFVDQSGEQAASHIRNYLSDDVDLTSIEKASGRNYSEIDCHERWYRITLRPEAAEKWQDTIHAKLEKSASLDSGGFIEGVHRTVTKPILPEASLGKPPRWWKLPAIDFRVTERMKWNSHGTGYANALYSGFDPSTNTLWIYDYGHQHGKLWDRGAVPAGHQFVSDSSKKHEEPQGEIQSPESESR